MTCATALGDDLLRPLSQALGMRQGLDILERRLLECLDVQNRPDPEVQEVVRLMELRPGEISVSDLHRRMGVSERQLQRHFLGHFGLAPRAFKRLVRFRLALRFLRRRPTVAWAELASGVLRWTSASVGAFGSAAVQVARQLAKSPQFLQSPRNGLG